MYKIGIDLGGTKIESVLLDENNLIIKKERILTEKQKGDLIKAAFRISEEKASEINIMMEEGVVHGLNYKGALAKLKRQGDK